MTRFLSRITPNFDILEGFIVIVLTYALKYTLIAFITQNELLRLQKEKLELELNALKSQIHPHFLFNTLNNLYSLTLKNSEKASEVVLKLSDIMRYVLYQANENKVLLNKEITFVKNYVDLQKIRYNQKYTINLEVEGKIEEQLVAPLLFIDFVENAFKHGLEKRFNDGFVDIKFIYNENRINLKVINSKGQSDHDAEKHDYEQSGIGLANVKKRLALIYGEKHQLDIKDTEESYTVNLNIDLST
jgi:LytS/YehU family sensor histidine kinase